MVRVNGDTGNNYNGIKFFASASTANSTSTSNSSFFLPSSGSARGWSTDVGSIVFDFNNYSNTTQYKTALYSAFEGGTSSGGLYVILWSGTWQNTAAITSITAGNLSNNMDSGSVASLYGIKAA